MRRIVALTLSIMLILLCGCDKLGEGLGELVGYDPTNSKLLKPEDSVVRLIIYPENGTYEQIDKFDRYQYQHLTERQKSIYIVIDNAIYNMQTGYVGVGNCTRRDLELAYHAVRRDRPEYFWLPHNYSLKTTGQYREIRFAENDTDWYCTKDERGVFEQEIKNSLTTLLSEVGADKSEYEREIAAHDFICKMVSYDDAAAASPVENNPLAWTAQSVFCKGRSVCAGYSTAMQIASYALGLDCNVVTGMTTEAHMWNIINIDGEWYHLDLTSNDSGDMGYMAFFNVTEEILNKVRIIDKTESELTDDQLERGNYNISVPPCRSLTSNYFVKNSLYVAQKSQLKPTVISAWTTAITNGDNRIEICLDPKLGFVCGNINITDMIDLKDCLTEINETLPKKKRITKFSYGGLTGATSFTISW